MKAKKRIILIIGIIILIIVTATTVVVIGRKGMKNNNKNSNTFVYDPNVPIDEIKEEKNKALYIILFQTNKKVEDYELLEKNENNHYVYYDKSVNECYEADLEENLVITTINCR